eukprot:356949-Chlamydomonas_euryale.AAC.3
MTPTPLDTFIWWNDTNPRSDTCKGVGRSRGRGFRGRCVGEEVWEGGGKRVGRGAWEERFGKGGGSRMHALAHGNVACMATATT